MEQETKNAISNLNSFMYLVKNMRDLQKDYFAGKKSVFKEAKNAERMVDNSMAALERLGYAPGQDPASIPTAQKDLF